jgi:hypothetical protein
MGFIYEENSIEQGKTDKIYADNTSVNRLVKVGIHENDIDSKQLSKNK